MKKLTPAINSCELNSIIIGRKKFTGYIALGDYLEPVYFIISILTLSIDNLKSIFVVVL